MKKLTINDIANKAGVAKSTVSKYLNGGSVSEKTSEIIRKVIEENNYEPNAFAQSLKAKKTKFIGIIVPRLDSVVTSRVVMEADSKLKEFGYNSLILNTNNNEKLELEKLESLIRLKVDGIIFIATNVTEEHKKLIKSLKIPIVIVGQEIKDVPSIVNDDFNGGKALGFFLGEKCLSTVLYLGVDSWDNAVGIKRKEGLYEGLKEKGIDKIFFEKVDFTMESGEKKAEEFLRNKKVDLIVGATDRIAIGAIKALKNLSLEIPKDISVAGFGGYDISSIISPELTTVRFNNEETGELAARTLVNIINDETVPIVQRIDFKIVKGKSTFSSY